MLLLTASWKLFLSRSAGGHSLIIKADMSLDLPVTGSTLLMFNAQIDERNVFATRVILSESVQAT